MDQKGFSAGSLVAGLLIGGAIGLAIGLVFAPQSGSETRTMIKQKAEATQAKAGEIVTKARTTARKIRRRSPAASRN